MPNMVVQVQIHYRVGPQPGMNVLHFFANVGVGVTDVDSITQDAIGAFVVDLESLWRDVLPEDVQIVGYKGRRVSPSGGPTVIVPASGVFGTRTGHFSAGSVGPCVIASYMQGDGDWRAGRIFLPGVSEADIQENQFDATLITALDALYDELLDFHVGPVVSQSWEYCIYSRTHNEFSGVEALTTSGRPGTQRGRLKPAF